MVGSIRAENQNCRSYRVVVRVGGGVVVRVVGVGGGGEGFVVLREN